MKPSLRWTVFVLACLTLSLSMVACGPKKTTTNVTGKRNGGNGLPMSKAEIKDKLRDIKPKLTMVFQGLQKLTEAENIQKDSTDFRKFPEVKALVENMISPQNTADIFTNIDHQGNIELSEKSCIDFRGQENIAATEGCKVQSKICLSMPLLRQRSQKGQHIATEIMILSLIAHEFGHHYTKCEDDEADEKLVQKLQAFVSFQLTKFRKSDEDDSSIYLTNSPYIDRFVDDSQTKLANAKKLAESN